MRPFTATEIVDILLYKEAAKTEKRKPIPLPKDNQVRLSTLFRLAVYIAASAPQLLYTATASKHEDRSFRRARGALKAHGFTDKQVDVFRSIVQSTLHACLPCSVTTETVMDESNFLGVPGFGVDGSGMSFINTELRQAQEDFIRGRLLASFNRYCTSYPYAATPGASAPPGILPP